MINTKFDKILYRIKNYPILSIMIAFGLIVISIATFTDALKNVITTASSLVGPLNAAEFSGYWVTKNDDKSDPIYFEFKTVKDKLYGSVWLTPNFWMQNSHSGILDGHILGKHFSFTTNHEYTKEFGMLNIKTNQRSSHVKGNFVDKYEGDVYENKIILTRISNGSYTKLFASKVKGFRIKLIGYGYLEKGRP